MAAQERSRAAGDRRSAGGRGSGTAKSAKSAKAAGGRASGRPKKRKRGPWLWRQAAASRAAAPVDVWMAGFGAPAPALPQPGDQQPEPGGTLGGAPGRSGRTVPGLPAVQRPLGYTPRRSSGLTGYERVLARAGLGPVAGIDEAGRGACAGPLVVAAVAIGRWDSAAMAGIADSKALTAAAREAAYATITRRALAWNVVIIEPGEIDRLGLHVCNVAGMRRALAGLAATPGYVLTDGFEVPGLAVPSLAMWKGDQVAACVAAASIVAKVTRDRIMTGLHKEYPQYGFSRHKGYSTPSHMAALDECGPSPVHRRSFVNVSSRLGAASPGADGVILADGSVLALDEAADSPIVELVAELPAAASAEGRT
ncbi:MAG TPA: ribonuclease HII [Streptosporangiaceae bacterium]